MNGRARGGSQRRGDDLPPQPGDADGPPPGDVFEAFFHEQVRVQPQEVGNRRSGDARTSMEFRAHPTWHQCGDVHPHSCCLQRQCLGIVLCPGLDGRVIVLCEACAHRADIDDPSPATSDHCPCCGSADDEHSSLHHLETSIVLLEILVEQTRAHRESGVVDDDVDCGFGARVLDPRSHPRLLASVREVGDHGLDPNIELAADLFGKGVEVGAISGYEHQIKTPTGEGAGEGSADSSASTSDKSHIHTVTIHGSNPKAGRRRITVVPRSRDA